MGNGREFCTVVEYRLTQGGEVSRHTLGSLELVKGRLAEDVKGYVEQVCATQGEGCASVVVVTRELYGVNEASYVCRGGEVVLEEGPSGCYRGDELIGELKETMGAGRRTVMGSWLSRALRRVR